jgi:hypothetical protein
METDSYRKLGNWSLAASEDKAARFAVLTLTIAISWPWRPSTHHLLLHQ